MNVYYDDEATCEATKEPLVTTLYPSCSRLLRMTRLEEELNSRRRTFSSRRSG